MQIIGYGRRNITEVIIMKNLDSSGKKDYIKKLWQEDPKKYAKISLLGNDLTDTFIFIFFFILFKHVLILF